MKFFNFSVSIAFGLAAYLVRATDNPIESASVCVALSTTVGNTDELHLLEDVYISFSGKAYVDNHEEYLQLVDYTPDSSIPITGNTVNFGVLAAGEEKKRDFTVCGPVTECGPGGVDCGPLVQFAQVRQGYTSKNESAHVTVSYSTNWNQQNLTEPQIYQHRSMSLTLFPTKIYEAKTNDMVVAPKNHLRRG